MKKRLLTSFFTIAIVLSSMVVCASAITTYPTYEDLTYKVVNEETITIVDCSTSARGELVIPAYIDGYPVTCIGDSAFSHCTLLTGITIPPTVTEIEAWAFNDCPLLTGMVIPEGVISIGNYAFARCTSLSDIYLPATLATIGAYAFYDCSSLKYVELQEGLLNIGANAFSSCSNLTSIVIPNSVLAIGTSAFSLCKSLTAVYYLGSASEFSSIAIGSSNTYLTTATLHCGSWSSYRVYCNQKGVKIFYCTSCEKTFSLITPPTDHTYTSKVTTAATYTKTGVMTYTCTICGDSYTETIARLGLHSGICAIDAFADITSTSAWYYSAVDYVYHNKIMSGTVAGTGNNDGTFNYSGTVTRAQAVQILYAQAGSPSVAGLENPFTDVKTSDWYYKAVVWAYNNGVTSGTSATTFSPNSEVTREQIICFLYNYTTQVLGRDVSKDATNDLSAYSDASSVSSWARTAVKWSVGNSIVTGTSTTTLSPQATANRATAAQILYTYRINYLGLEIE